MARTGKSSTAGSFCGASTMMDAAGETSDARSATSEAADWLTDHLTSEGGSDTSASIKAAGRKAGHSESALKRARQRIKATSTSSGFPRQTFWTLAGTAPQSGHASQSSPGESGLTELTGPTGLTEAPVGPVGPVGSVGSVPARGEPTEDRRCSSCGEPLLLIREGRTTCARCQRKAGAA